MTFRKKPDKTCVWTHSIAPFRESRLNESKPVGSHFPHLSCETWENHPTCEAADHSGISCLMASHMIWYYRGTQLHGGTVMSIDRTPLCSSSIFCRTLKVFHSYQTWHPGIISLNWMKMMTNNGGQTLLLTLNCVYTHVLMTKSDHL